MSIDKFRDYGHERSSIDQTVKGFSDTLKEARQKRVKAWLAEKWEYVTDRDFLLDSAAFCLAVALILGFGWCVKRVLEILGIIGGQ